MKNKRDAINPANKPRRGKKAEFTPFWSSGPAKTEDNQPAKKSAASRASGGRPAPGEKGAHKERKEHEAEAAPSRDNESRQPRTTQEPRTHGRPKREAPVAGERAPRHKAERTEGSHTEERAQRQERSQRAEKPERAERRETPGGNKKGPAARHEPATAARKQGSKGERGRVEEQKPLLHSGQTLELKIVSTNDEGFGVATHQGNRVLVSGALPGEVLVGRVTYVGRREAFANTLRLVKGSPDREPAPACGLGRACDGCGLMHMRYPAQLAWKKELVTREIRKYQSLSEVRIHDTVASPKELNYRNTAKLVVAGKNQDPVIGIYRRNTHDVMEIEDCQLHHPLINQVVKAVKAGIKKGKVPIYNPKSEMGLLRYLVVRVAEPSNKVMVVFVTSEESYNEMHHLAKFVQKAVPEVTVVAQNINTSTGNVIFGQKERFLTKLHTLRANVGFKSFNLSPHSFFQVNSGAAEIIYKKVREFAALTGTERVIDVYCGIGGISLYLADRAREVVGIEFVEAAVNDAIENAALNHTENCEFEAGDAANLLDEIGEEGGAEVVVLNPPRKGCDEKVLRSVAAIKPPRIIYVSCSPETLARDLDILARLGYRTLEVQPVDMFPQTVHVEDVALLERIKE